MQFRKQEVFTIPNILTYIRILSLPFFLWMMFGSLSLSGKQEFIYIVVGLVIFVFAEITDVVDGKIARRFNMVSDIGKVLDPIADKLVQCFAILTLACITKEWFAWMFMAVLIAKEVYMGVHSRFIMVASKKQVEQMANKVGKVGAVFNFVELCLLFIFNILSRLGWAFSESQEVLGVICDVVKYLSLGWACVCVVTQIYAAYNYTRIYNTRLRELRKSGILDTLDKDGNPLVKE